MPIIDLTRPFTVAMPVFPGDAEIGFTQTHCVARNGYANYRLATGMHVGTHIDAPAHMLEDGCLLSQFPLEHFIGRGVLIDARNVSEIKLNQDSESRIRPDDIVFFLTGHGAKYGQPEYFTAYPTLAFPFAEWLVRVGVRMVGFDTPSPDIAPFAVHKRLFTANICIIENLTNLDALLGVEDFKVYAFPLYMQADAAPARVAAKIV